MIIENSWLCCKAAPSSLVNYNIDDNQRRKESNRTDNEIHDGHYMQPIFAAEQIKQIPKKTLNARSREREHMNHEQDVNDRP